MDTETVRIDRENDEEEEIELSLGETSLDLLQRIYRSTRQPMSRRLRAAIEALPFENPKLSAMAISALSGADFAARLDRAIERSAAARFPKLIEAKALPE